MTCTLVMESKMGKVSKLVTCSIGCGLVIFVNQMESILASHAP